MLPAAPHYPQDGILVSETGIQNTLSLTHLLSHIHPKSASILFSELTRPFTLPLRCCCFFPTYLPPPSPSHPTTGLLPRPSWCPPLAGSEASSPSLLDQCLYPGWGTRCPQSGAVQAPALSAQHVAVVRLKDNTLVQADLCPPLHPANFTPSGRTQRVASSSCLIIICAS